ncbi:hypothetical protein ACHAWU_009613 [Discostella pseudostelligera]|uniref:Helicase-associated domain-containing protein n=1 Tax=Discostella pseudostelligera TaxID=259834 RepID=A0ABD3ME99_9STRA
MEMEEAMTMIAAGDLNDLSDNDNDDGDGEEDDDETNGLIGITTTDMTMDLPPPQLPPLLPLDSSLKSPPEIDDSNNNNNNKPKYYAVRVGYAVAKTDEDDDSVGDNKPVATIRSAIFLHWEDVKQFVEFATSSTQQSAGVAGKSDEDEANASSKGSVAATAGGASAAAVGGAYGLSVPFHHNVEYKVFDDISRAERYLNKASTAASSSSSSSVATATTKKKSSSKSSKLKSSSTKMRSLMHLTMPSKSFNPITKKWQAMYEMALQYKATHGNLDVPSSSKDENYAQYEDLSKWIKYQRSSYRSYLENPTGGKHSMTDEKVLQLKEAGFTWISSDKRAWLEEAAAEGGSGAKKRGRPRKTASSNLRLNLAAAAATSGSSAAAVMVAGTGGKIPINKPIRVKWLATYQKLKEYKERTNSLDIPEEETDEELVALRLWVKGQKNLYSRWRQGYDVGMTQEKADMLKVLGMEFPPSWEDMYAKAVAYKVQHGNTLHGISKNSDDPILAAWIARQDEVLCRHLQGKGTRLSDDQAIKLLSLGVNGGQRGAAVEGGVSAPAAFVLGGGGTGGGSQKIIAMGRTEASVNFDEKWNAMFMKLREFKAEHGHCNVNTTSGTDLAHWVAAQRRMYNKLVNGKPGKRASLDAVKMQRLTDIGFVFRPRGSYTSWEDQMTALWQFRHENGHCRVPVNHPTLGSFVKLVRRDYKNWTLGKASSMTPEREAALKGVGFTFEGGKTPQRTDGPIKSWDERLEELIQFKAEFGHTVVPQNSGQLGAWVHSQRVHYKKFKAGEKSAMTAEKALRLTEMGFCFNASDRFRGNKRHRTHEQTAAEELQQQQQQQQLQQHQLQHQHDQHQQHYHMQEMVHVPQGFQPYI